MARVVGERALGRQRVDARARLGTAEPAGAVPRDLGESSVAISLIGDDLVAGGVVRLDEHRVPGGVGVRAGAPTLSAVVPTTASAPAAASAERVRNIWLLLGVSMC